MNNYFYEDLSIGTGFTKDHSLEKTSKYSRDLNTSIDHICATSLERMELPLLWKIWSGCLDIREEALLMHFMLGLAVHHVNGSSLRDCVLLNIYF